MVRGQDVRTERSESQIFTPSSRPNSVNKRTYSLVVLVIFQLVYLPPVGILWWLTSVFPRLSSVRYDFFDPAETESKVDPCSQLASTCDSVWPGVACTCDDLR